eukprot:gene4642-6523_t
MRLINIQRFYELCIINNSKHNNKSLINIGALDVGKKYVGLARMTNDWGGSCLIEPCGTIIRKVPRLEHESIQKLTNQLQEFVLKFKVSHLVIGFPLHMDGRLTPLCNEILSLAKQINIKSYDNNSTEVCCTFWDERNSTVGARSLAKSITKKKSYIDNHKDSFAACLILQGFLDGMHQQSQKK